jgi:phosphoglycolate phosphatase-like HAD superfamily hydrolase
LGATGAQAVMVGDHPTDIQVGQQVGAATVAVLSPGVGPERFAEVQPDLIVDHVTELVRYL